MDEIVCKHCGKRMSPDNYRHKCSCCTDLYCRNCRKVCLTCGDFHPNKDGETGYCVLDGYKLHMPERTYCDDWIVRPNR